MSILALHEPTRMTKVRWIWGGGAAGVVGREGKAGREGKEGRKEEKKLKERRKTDTCIFIKGSDHCIKKERNRKIRDIKEKTNI